MKKQSGYILLLLAAAAAVSSCGGNMGYKKTKSGILYKIYNSSNEPQVKEGNVVKFNYTVKLGSTDSLLFTSYGKKPEYSPIQAVNPQMGSEGNYSPTEVFPLLHLSDSVIVVQLVDSMLKKNPMQQLPAFLKKGDKLVYTFKIIHVFTTDSSARTDAQAEQLKDQGRQNAERAKLMEKAQKEADEDLKTQVPQMQAWLTDRKITAQKTGKGTFVVITDPGAGLQADSGKYVTVRYTGKTLDGKIFETTMDPKARPYTFMVGTRGAIAGWDEGLPMFKKGGKGTLYIPSALAYGKNPPPNAPFKPNEALMFDIQVVDVTTTPPQQEAPPTPPQGN